MSDATLRRPDQGEGEGPEAFDHDVNLRAIVWITGGLVAIMVIVSALIWWIVRGFERFDERRDPEPPPIALQVEPPRMPPGPRLQPSPERDLGAMRTEEAERLERAAWVDRRAGTVRLPIEVAIDAFLAGVRPVPGAPPHGVATGAGQPGTPMTGAGSVGAPFGGVQPFADAESLRPRPETEEAPPPW